MWSSRSVDLNIYVILAVNQFACAIVLTFAQIPRVLVTVPGVVIRAFAGAAGAKENIHYC